MVTIRPMSSVALMMLNRKEVGEIKEIGDLVLLVDYIMSLQFFRTFRVAAGKITHDKEDGLSLHDIKNKERIGHPMLLRAIQDYLAGLKEVLSKQPIGPGSIDLWEIAQKILYAELKLPDKSAGSNLPWIEQEHGHLLLHLESVPIWREAKEGNSVSPLKLNILFLKKLEGEHKRHTAGRYISAEDDTVFTETDRIVKRLLSTSEQPGKNGKASAISASLPDACWSKARHTSNWADTVHWGAEACATCT